MKKTIIKLCFDGKSMDYAKLCEKMEDLGKRIVAACETNENGIAEEDLPVVLLVLDNLRSTIQGQIQRDPMMEAAYKLLPKAIGAYGVVVQHQKEGGKMRLFYPWASLVGLVGLAVLVAVLVAVYG